MLNEGHEIKIATFNRIPTEICTRISQKFKEFFNGENGYVKNESC